jgi:DNA topoisomerase I
VEVHPLVYENFSIFLRGKKKSEDVFDQLNSVTLNAHLKKYMDGLSAKVFRTFNASFTLQKELSKVKFKKGTTVEERVLGILFFFLFFFFFFFLFFFFFFFFFSFSFFSFLF